MASVSKDFYKSSLPTNSELLYALARPRLPQFADCTTANALCPCVLDNIHTGANVGAAYLVSYTDNDRSTDRIGRNASKSVLKTVFQDQFNRSSKIRPAFIDRASLSVSSRNFRTVADKPIPVLFNDCSKLSVHFHSLAASIIYHHAIARQSCRPLGASRVPGSRLRFPPTAAISASEIRPYKPSGTGAESSDRSRAS